MSCIVIYLYCCLYVLCCYVCPVLICLSCVIELYTVVLLVSVQKLLSSLERLDLSYNYIEEVEHLVVCIIPTHNIIMI